VSIFDEVTTANLRFYDAHEARDLAAMGAIWEHSERAVCVHPGWPILRGWAAIEESWRRIFEGPGRNQFILTNQSVFGQSDLAWVTLEENLMDRGETHAVAATNVFVRTEGQWRLVSHHGSPVMVS
jgi:ketosteroid isomerase-like protein